MESCRGSVRKEVQACVDEKNIEASKQGGRFYRVAAHEFSGNLFGEKPSVTYVAAPIKNCFLEGGVIKSISSDLDASSCFKAVVKSLPLTNWSLERVCQSRLFGGWCWRSGFQVKVRP